MPLVNKVSSQGAWTIIGLALLWCGFVLLFIVSTFVFFKHWALSVAFVPYCFPLTSAFHRRALHNTAPSAEFCSDHIQQFPHWKMGGQELASRSTTCKRPSFSEHRPKWICWKLKDRSVGSFPRGWFSWWENSFTTAPRTAAEEEHEAAAHWNWFGPWFFVPAGARECQEDVMGFVPEMNCDCAFFPRKCAYAEFSSKLCGLKATNSKMPAAKHLANLAVG